MRTARDVMHMHSRHQVDAVHAVDDCAMYGGCACAWLQAAVARHATTDICARARACMHAVMVLLRPPHTHAQQHTREPYPTRLHAYAYKHAYMQVCVLICAQAACVRIRTHSCMRLRIGQYACMCAHAACVPAFIHVRTRISMHVCACTQMRRRSISMHAWMRINMA